MVKAALSTILLIGITCLSAGKASTVREDTVVLCGTGDPYRTLAMEIAEAETLVVTDSLDEALDRDPIFLLWVVSPPHLSDSVFIAVGKTLQARASSVSLGIISGSSIESARNLWRRASRAGGGTRSLVGPVRPPRHRAGQVILSGPGRAEARPLTRETLRDALTESDYLVFRGGGGGEFWILDEQTTFRADDIPALPPLVIASGACQTFRLWREHSIGLAFTDRGAASYAGFVYSPVPSYLIGFPGGFPYRYTWPGYPVGHIVRIQAQGFVKGIASFPWFHLLGDPRISLGDAPPYRLVRDRMEGPVRVLEYDGAPDGFIPVRVSGGAGYSFVEVVGGSASWEGDPFYNGRLQMIDMGSDKYLLFEHHGGDFTLRLHPSAPWHRLLSVGIRDALDHTFVFLPTTGGPIFTISIGISVAIVIVWFLLRRETPIRSLITAVAVGLCFSALVGCYMVLRIDNVSVVSRSLSFDGYFMVDVCLLVGCGMFIFLNSTSRFAKVAAVLVAAFPTWTAAAFWFGTLVAYHLIGSGPHLGTTIYRMIPSIMPFITFVIMCLVIVPVFVIVRRRSRGAT